MATREIDERINGHLAIEVSTPSHQNADTRAERAAASERGPLRPLLADFGLAEVTLRLRHGHGGLAVRVADDGWGFDPAHTPGGAGVQNIRDRIEPRLRSPHGTVLSISLPWPAAADGRR